MLRCAKCKIIRKKVLSVKCQSHCLSLTIRVISGLIDAWISVARKHKDRFCVLELWQLYKKSVWSVLYGCQHTSAQCLCTCYAAYITPGITDQGRMTHETCRSRTDFLPWVEILISKTSPRIIMKCWWSLKVVLNTLNSHLKVSWYH